MARFCGGLGPLMSSPKNKDFSSGAETRRKLGICSLRPLCDFQPDLDTMDPLDLCFVRLEALGGGVGRRWGRVNYAADSHLFFWDGEAWFSFAMLDCTCSAKQAWWLELIHLKTKSEFSVFRLPCSDCVFNNCSFFSRGGAQNRRVDVDSKLYFLVTILEWCTFLMSVILVQSIAVGCFFFLKEKKWPENFFFKDLQIPNIKYVNTLCPWFFSFLLSLRIYHVSSSSLACYILPGHP